MKTTIQKGKVYQIGERYVDENGNIGVLDSCDGRTFKMSSFSRGFWFCDGLITFEMGTIEDAQIEPEDGQWYMCDLESGPAPLQWGSGHWLFSDGCTFDTVHVGSVIPLHKMGKA
tara:strand:+ start:237 stop:581 length:345 start_codon:yes stop_codon:yes gene_type:complete